MSLISTGYTVSEYSQNVASRTLYSNGMNVISPMNIKEADPQFVTYNEYAYGVGRYEVFDGRKVSPGSGWNSAFHPSTGNCYQQQLPAAII